MEEELNNGLGKCVARPGGREQEPEHHTHWTPAAAARKVSSETPLPDAGCSGGASPSRGRLHRSGPFREG